MGQTTQLQRERVSALNSPKLYQVIVVMNAVYIISDGCRTGVFPADES